MSDDKNEGLKPPVDSAYYWRRLEDGSYELRSRWGHRRIAELPRGAHPDKRAIVVIDLEVDRLTPDQRAVFDRLSRHAAHGLDPHAFLAVLAMIRAGLGYAELAKYVGAASG